MIHCHPPHATAYAITGLIPPGEIIPEQEVFIGPVATAAYETPGTKSFAETVLPFVRSHNTVLLENHGVVCWADTVTHAEWCVEVLDTYCRTLILASQLDSPIRRIPQDKISGLLAIKQRLGLPDARFDVREHDSALSPTIATNPPGAALMSRPAKRNRDESFEKLIKHLTNEVIRFASLQKK